MGWDGEAWNGMGARCGGCERAYQFDRKRNLNAYFRLLFVECDK